MSRRYSMSRCALICTLLLSHRLVLGNDEPTRLAPESPFGVVCPWPELAGSGIGWCRVGAGATSFMNWVDIQPERGTWNWITSDAELQTLYDPLGLSLLPIFGYTPTWASSAPRQADAASYPPRDLRDLSRFVQASVSRYQQRVKVWEVWNEANIGFFRGSAAEYAEMIKAAAVAARRADPDCRIAIGCAGVDTDFLQRLYEFGCGPYFDIMSVHPYQWGRHFNDGHMADKLRACRELMERHGDRNKEIWVTEIGWSLAEGVSAEDQAALLIQAFVTALSLRESLGVEKVFWFSAKDWGGPGHGLVDVDGRPKPALVAYRSLIQELADTIYVGSWSGSDELRGHVFQHDGQRVLVIWSPTPDTCRPTTLHTQAEKLVARTVTGSTVELAASAGQVTIDVQHAPLFIRGWQADDLLTVHSAPACRPTQVGTRPPLGEIWTSVVPAPTTARPYLVLGGCSELPLRIHNDSSHDAGGTLQLELARNGEVFAQGSVPFQVPAESSHTMTWCPNLPPRPELAGELAELTVRGVTSGQTTPEMKLPVRLVRNRAIEFAANSHVEHQYLHESDKSGCADSIRFGSSFGYRFETRNMQAAQLKINVGANGGNPWRVLVSTNGTDYTQECAGQSWPAWHTVPLDKYLPAEAREGAASLFIRIEGTDCQVRELQLEMEAIGRTRPALFRVHHQSPTELVVYDARPELGIGMHAVTDQNLPLVRELGVRFVRHTMYWYLMENTDTPGQYDETQLRHWDQLLETCRTQGIIPVVVVHGNAPGAGWDTREASYERFARFLGDMARRFPDIRYWELWNEMDGAFTDLFGAGRADVTMRRRGELYAQMLRTVYPSVRAANPRAWVLVGGMTDWNEFPRGIYEGAGRNYFDIMALHTYGVPLEWSFSGRGLALRRIMAEYGDGEKPLWNTEFGIDAGNFVGAWGYPHEQSPPADDAEYFDQQQLRQWQDCLAANRELGLYTKLLPYQFAAGNERNDDGLIVEKVRLPEDMTIDDFGFGIVRRDGTTPRPLYEWLKTQQVNHIIQQQPTLLVDVRCQVPDSWYPVGYDYLREADELVIRGVTVDSTYPTRIELAERAQ